MAFLFKSKKSQQQQNSALPPATRNVHTSEGSPSTATPALNGSKERDRNVSQTPTPSSSYNNSLSSMTNPGSPDQQRLRQRADSESQAQRPPQAMNGAIPSPQSSPNASLYPWSQRRVTFSSPQMNPFPRYGAAINSVASKEGDIYMMGGLIDGATVKGDLWMIESNTGSLSCIPIATVSEGPGPRVGHASLLVGNAFIVFGGDTKVDENDTLDDTLYLLNTSSRQWSRAIPPGARPTGRYGHTLSILGSKLYVFGGQVEGFFFNDLVAFDLNQLQNPTNKWELLIRNSHDGGPAPGQIPPARTNHTIVSYNDRLYLFGGTNGTQWFNDVWTYDPRPNQWSQLECVGFIPMPREGHAAALVNDVMYIFGGRTDEGIDLGDLAAFRISTKRWYSFQNMGPAPSPRSGHSMTAFGKHIIVMGGEPSSAPRDPVELSMSYILDTSKIRYPVEAQNGEKGALAGVRKMSSDKTSPTTSSGRTSREAQNYAPEQAQQVQQPLQAQQAPLKGPSSMPSRESMTSPNGRPAEFGTSPGPGSRLPRASIAQAPSGPPPPGQAPTPGPRGSAPQPAVNPRSKTPTKLDRGGFASPPPVDGAKSMTPDRGRASPGVKEAAKPVVQEQAAAPHPSRTPSQQQQQQQQSRMSAKAMEAGEAAPLISAPARQRSLRQKQRSSLDSTDESILGRQASVDSSVEARSLRNSKNADEAPRSPKLNLHQEALTKELESAKSRNAWYASELALAKKSGYAPSPSGPSAAVNDKTPDMFTDEDRPLIEAFLAMRAELAKMQATVDRQAAIASKRVAEVEHQRDLAVNEAAYSRAKLAAHGGSQQGTPQPDVSAQDTDGTISERGTDISRRLAIVLASQAELTAKLESMTTDLEQEKRGRELAEETSEATRKRLTELEMQTNSLEAESLRGELHQVEASAREESLLRSQAETALKQVTFDKDELERKLEESSVRLRDYGTNLGTLRAAVAASSGKTSLIEKQLEEEREIREGLERRLLQLRSEHEERSSELDNAHRRLRDAEELADSHAKEAETHKVAFLTGLERATSFDLESTTRSVADQRVEALEAHVSKANELAKANQAAADQATDKLRRAEERIAGLEAYQEQASREGLQLRRQLQSVMKESQSTATENRDLKSKLENHLRDSGALAIQHSALKDLLGERGTNLSDSRRSPRLDSPGSRYGTPEQGRLRELEQQLVASTKSNDELKTFFESREQEADRAYREKLEQLENDYQSAVHYVKGTEKMLKRMKDELARYKTHNVKLQSDLEASRKVESAAAAKEAPGGDWEMERSKLHKSISDLQQDTSLSIANLERQITQLKTDVSNAEQAKDKSQTDYKTIKQELVSAAEQTRGELEQLKHENQLLETRASDAEHKVTILLDQVENSVGNYRRQSHHGQGTNGIMTRTYSNASSNTVGRSRADSAVSQDDPSFPDNRGSMALDSLANELETLRSHWESTNRNYRLSAQSDLERTPTKDTYDGTGNGGLSDSLAEWRRRLDEEESRADSPVTGADGNKSKPSNSNPSGGSSMDTTNMI